MPEIASKFGQTNNKLLQIPIVVGLSSRKEASKSISHAIHVLFDLLLGRILCLFCIVLAFYAFIACFGLDLVNPSSCYIVAMPL